MTLGLTTLEYSSIACMTFAAALAQRTTQAHTYIHTSPYVQPRYCIALYCMVLHCRAMPNLCLYNQPQASSLVSSPLLSPVAASCACACALNPLLLLLLLFEPTTYLVRILGSMTTATIFSLRTGIGTDRYMKGSKVTDCSVEASSMPSPSPSP